MRATNRPSWLCTITIHDVSGAGSAPVFMRLVALFLRLFSFLFSMLVATVTHLGTL
jgi:hypothetical protein